MSVSAIADATGQLLWPTVLQPMEDQLRAVCKPQCDQHGPALVFIDEKPWTYCTDGCAVVCVPRAARPDESEGERGAPIRSLICHGGSPIARLPLSALLSFASRHARIQVAPPWPCPKCSNSELVTCPECNGEAETECDECGQSRECERCGGDGNVDCSCVRKIPPPQKNTAVSVFGLTIDADRLVKLTALGYHGIVDVRCCDVRCMKRPTLQINAAGLVYIQTVFNKGPVATFKWWGR